MRNAIPRVFMLAALCAAPLTYAATNTDVPQWGMYLGGEQYQLKSDANSNKVTGSRLTIGVSNSNLLMNNVGDGIYAFDAGIYYGKPTLDSDLGKTKVEHVGAQIEATGGQRFGTTNALDLFSTIGADIGTADTKAKDSIPHEKLERRVAHLRLGAGYYHSGAVRLRFTAGVKQPFYAHFKDSIDNSPVSKYSLSASTTPFAMLQVGFGAGERTSMEFSAYYDPTTFKASEDGSIPKQKINTYGLRFAIYF